MGTMSGIHSSIPQAVLAQYDAQEKIGEGTYGIVYKAWDVVKERYIALKKIRVESLVSFSPAPTNLGLVLSETE